MADSAGKLAFIEFEAEADQQISKLILWDGYARSIITFLFHSADVDFSGGRFGRYRLRDIERGSMLLSRMSYLVPYFRQTRKVIGAGVIDALNALSKREIEQIRDTLIYAHFCELAPQVRNGYLRCEQTQYGDFVLDHPSAEVAKHEVMDVVASELAMAFIGERPPLNVKALQRMAKLWPHLRSDDVIGVLHDAHAFFLRAVVENPFIAEEDYAATMGFSRASFHSVRAAMMSLAHWCSGMATASEAIYLNKAKKRKRNAEHWATECLEWSAPLLDKGFVVAILKAISKVSDEEFDRIFQFFVEDLNSKGSPLSGDGYLAPIIAFPKSYLISPRALHLMTTERNLLYVLNRTERKTFDDVVSHQLEPELLVSAANMFRQLPDVLVATNVQWAEGEIDLLVFSPQTNSALQVQAKAGIPPQGARMTRQVESNTLKAVAQLNRFDAIPPAERDRILSQAFGIGAKGVAWAGAVLVRSSFGTSKAWSELAGRAPFNPPLLKLLVNEHQGQNVDLTTFPTRAWQSLETISEALFERWDNDEIILFGKTIVIPLMRLNNSEVFRIRATLA
ncbi:hypothetical protein [Sinorhizobium fredii]|uniref:hypothetical protein n=1 Tax=Rhizobium fredii TaxID=380 RepID=UPI0004ACAA61|nr:hypothetical protein [Sinorhizobium fredii]